MRERKNLAFIHWAREDNVENPDAKREKRSRTERDEHQLTFRTTLPAPLQISVFVATLAGGGLERTMVTIADGFARRGHCVNLLVCRKKGQLADKVPAPVRVRELRAAPMWWARWRAVRADAEGIRQLLRPFLLTLKPPHSLAQLPALADHLMRDRPDVLVSAMPQENLIAVQARALAAVPTRLVLTEHNTLSLRIAAARSANYRHLSPLIARQYPMAEAIVAVSHGVADDLARQGELPRERISVIYNPVVPQDVSARINAPPPHHWLQVREPPVVLGVGSLVPQKDFPTLIRAFVHLRRSRPARLVILGEATEAADTPTRSAELRRLASELGVAEDVDLPGYVENPYPWMARASVFVLSSTYEGFGNVLPEALACGCPVVSTDCPSGPAEILDGGRYGRLVPVGDDRALGEAIAATLDDPPAQEMLRQRATAFSVERAIDQYEELVVGLVHQQDGASGLLPTCAPAARGGALAPTRF
jgi:glycosyltransferase involved in cell wall biosynthesis